MPPKRNDTKRVTDNSPRLDYPSNEVSLRVTITATHTNGQNFFLKFPSLCQTQQPLSIEFKEDVSVPMRDWQVTKIDGEEQITEQVENG